MNLVPKKIIENTKNLGKFDDAIFQKNTHSVYPEWVENTKDKYYGFDNSGALEWTPIYYDPLIDHIHAAGPSNGLTIAEPSSNMIALSSTPGTDISCSEFGCISKSLSVNIKGGLFSGNSK